MKKKIFIVFSLLFILISVLPKENVFAKDLDGLKIEEELRGPVSEWIPYEVKSKYNEGKGFGEEFILMDTGMRATLTMMEYILTGIVM